MTSRGKEERAELRKLIEEELERAKTGIATRKDIEELSAKIDTLAEKLAGE
jgi:polyhydroxyalkanoate synthesis regulator phasin